MANKVNADSPLWPVTPTHPAPKNEETDDGHGIEERFREAIQRGDTNGDVVFLDEQGNEIKDALSTNTIFDF